MLDSDSRRLAPDRLVTACLVFTIHQDSKLLLQNTRMNPAFDSPFSEHVRTNYVPSSIEKAHISELLVAPQQEVCVLDAEIAELQKEFDEIKARRDGLMTIVTEHQRLLAPSIRRVPDNILKLIFINCVPHRIANMVLSEAPLLLGLVCRRWREVAYDTARLWATLHISQRDIPRPTNALLEAEFGTREYPITSRVRCHLDAVLRWLNRSGTCPLSLSIHSSHDTVGFHLYLQIFLSFSHRWLDIGMRVKHESASMDLDILASTPPDAFPILRTLCLTFPRELDTDETPSSQWITRSGILSAKELRSISIKYFPFDLANMEMDWSHLTSLVLCDPYSAKRPSTPGEAYRILSHCVNLRHLTMAIYDPSPATGVQFATPSFYLPHLESFSVNDHYYYLATLFDGMDAPSLRQVFYSTQFGPTDRRRSPLVALLSQNGQSIHSLTMDPRNFTLADVLECFKMAPSISKFVCKASNVETPKEHQTRQIYCIPIIPYVMKAIFQLLAPNDDSQCYWPKLQVIESMISDGLDDQIVLTFIQKRMAAAVQKNEGDILPLTEVTIFFDCAKKLDIASILEEYTKDGLRLNLRGYHNFLDNVSIPSYAHATRAIFASYVGITHYDRVVTPF